MAYTDIYIENGQICTLPPPRFLEELKCWTKMEAVDKCEFCGGKKHLYRCMAYKKALAKWGKKHPEWQNR